MIFNCYNEFLLIVICVLLSVIVSLADKANGDTIVLLILSYLGFMVLQFINTASITKTFMDRYIIQSCPDYIRALISFVGIMGLPVITGIITVAIMCHDHSQKK